MDLLLAAERACSMLGGMKVTFCKSGKDRTGMAVTLDQARQLGERFNCGARGGHGAAMGVGGGGGGGGGGGATADGIDPGAVIAGTVSAEEHARLLKDAALMRSHGTRIEICLKNIGRRVYSINKLQAQFLPVLLRPPPDLLEDLFKKDLS